MHHQREQAEVEAMHKRKNVNKLEAASEVTLQDTVQMLPQGMPKASDLFKRT